MTPQEASEELKEEFEIFKNCIRKADWDNPNEELKKIIEANTMAIEILGQQPCEDCVSRQAVLETQTKYAEYMGATKFWQMRDDIKVLPSVTPTPKIGKWIDMKYKDEWWCPVGKCLNCGKEHILGSNYCPNCGAKMEE